MAPIGEKGGRMNSIAGGEKSRDVTQNLWATILSEVQASSASKLPSSKSILLLGDNESGKTTLVAKLQGEKETKKGAGLEYYYIDVKDDYRDDHAKLSCWVLDGDPQHSGLLKFCLTEETFSNTLVVMVASMAHPWFIMESLEKWATLLGDHLDRVKLPHDVAREYEQSLTRFFQEYTEPEEGQPLSQTTHRRDVNPLHPSAAQSDEDQVLLPLGENTLTRNLGLPIVVVITKSDAISTLEKENDFKEEHFDFIQQHIRKFCLKHGAALFYSSVKEDKNCDLLHRYLVHRIYGFPFTSPAYVVEKDCVFVPTGWDNEKKISILYENMNSVKPDESYEDVIVKPVTRKPVQKDAEVVAEEEQVFLMKQHSQLNKVPAAGAGGESPIRSNIGVAKTGTSPRTPGSVSGGSPHSTTPKKLDPTKAAGATSEGMLANFFNSLLSKKTGVPTSSKADKAAVTRDAAAELERMNRAKKSVAETTSVNDTNNTSAS